MFLLSPRVGRLSMRSARASSWASGRSSRVGAARRRAAEARLLLLVGAAAAAARLLGRPLDDRRAADGDRARRRRRARRGDRERRQQRRRARRRAARDRRRRRRGRRWRATSSTCRASASRCGSPPRSSAPAAPSASPGSGTGREQTTAAEIVFDHVTKRYAGRDAAAVDDLSLEIPAGAFCVLVGPSGGGKTTALKMVNRLIPFDSGEIRIDGRSDPRPAARRAAPRDRLRDPAGRPVPAHDDRREHRDGAAAPRLAEGADRARAPPSCSSSSGSSAADAKRYPAQLSGGQRQRVGLARALAADPPLLLMDEPFGALDPITRLRLQNELRRLHREVGKTIIFVTHDIDEAIQMGDRIAILREGGVLAQYDTPGRDPRPSGRRLRRAVHRRGPRAAAARAADARATSSCSRTSPGPSRRSPAASTTTVRNAVSLMLETTPTALVVDDGDQRARRRSACSDARSAAVSRRRRRPRHPQLRAGQRVRHAATTRSAGTGSQQHWSDTLGPRSCSTSS